jgi:Metallo-beta-lactamase superfamily
MKRWVRNVLLALCGLLVIAGAAYYWFIVESHVPGGAEYALDIGEVRRLAGAAPGDKPIAIEVEAVAMFKPPATFVVAGDGWKPSDLPVYSYRVVYPQTSVIIDTALNKELGSDNLASFDAAAFARMQAAMAQSSLILLTHEHADHIGGLTTHSNLAAVLAATKLTREQIADPTAMLPARFPDHALDGYVPLEYRKYDAVAPVWCSSSHPAIRRAVRWSLFKPRTVRSFSSWGMSPGIFATLKCNANVLVLSRSSRSRKIARPYSANSARCRGCTKLSPALTSCRVMMGWPSSG